MINQACKTRLFGLFLIGIGLSGSSWSLAQEAAKASATVAEAAPTPALIRLGQDLFLGATRFSAGGPSCNACHNVINDAVIGGGNLAMDLTESFGRLGADGIVETLPRKGAQSPFPVMQAAFQARDITADEGNALAAFLQDAHARRAAQKPNDLGSMMLLAGFSGVVFLLLLFSLVGQGRKRRSVNQEIYDRQVMTE
ncbi:MAG: hypothetical protein NTY41_05895 [Proteobacteria bacterium]|nr:hypothetical protein [Pseudomonadota bacterium]